MHLQERRASVQAIETDGARIHRQFLVEGIAEERIAAHTRARGPDHVDGALGRIDRGRQQVRLPRQRWQVDVSGMVKSSGVGIDGLAGGVSLHHAGFRHAPRIAVEDEP